MEIDALEMKDLEKLKKNEIGINWRFKVVIRYFIEPPGYNRTSTIWLPPRDFALGYV